MNPAPRPYSIGPNAECQCDELRRLFFLFEEFSLCVSEDFPSESEHSYSSVNTLKSRRWSGCLDVRHVKVWTHRGGRQLGGWWPPPPPSFFTHFDLLGCKWRKNPVWEKQTVNNKLMLNDCWDINDLRRKMNKLLIGWTSDFLSIISLRLISLIWKNINWILHKFLWWLNRNVPKIATLMSNI